jgi:hypothetical protein
MLTYSSASAIDPIQTRPLVVWPRLMNWQNGAYRTSAEIMILW